MEETFIPVYKRCWYCPVWKADRRSRLHIVSILQAGLLFREDSLAVESALLLEDAVANRVPPFRLLGRYGRGEALAATVGVGACFALLPLRLPLGSRGNLLRLACMTAVAAVPMLVRLLRPSTLPALLDTLARYTRAVRRSMAAYPGTERCELVARQQSALCRLLLDGCGALLQAFPWLESPGPWEEGPEVREALTSKDLTKIHHLFLVLQSTMLRRMALAHVPPVCPPRDYPRRLRWLHSTLLPALLSPVTASADCLPARLARAVPGDSHMRTALPGGLTHSWRYSQEQDDVARIGAIIRSALKRCNEIDFCLEASRNNNTKLKEKDLEFELLKLKDDIFKCSSAVDAILDGFKELESQAGKSHVNVERIQIPVAKENIKTVSEDTEMKIEDQVFYFEKKDDFVDFIVGDIVAGPGVKEMDTAKAVLGELRQRLVEREETMRVRETAALEKTMPELKGNLPEFPRQMQKRDESCEVGGKEKDADTECILRHKGDGDKRDSIESVKEPQIVTKKDNAEMILNSSIPKDLLKSATEKPAFDVETGKIVACAASSKSDLDKNGALCLNERCVEDVAESGGGEILKLVETVNLKCNDGIAKIDTEKPKRIGFLSDQFYEHGTTGSESDDDSDINLLTDVRKNRVTRKKNHPPSRVASLRSKRSSNDKSNDTSSSSSDTINKPNESGNNSRDASHRPNPVHRYKGRYHVDNADDCADESLQPARYCLGAGLAMASLMRGGAGSALGGEDTFAGEGEQSSDSGNEDN